MLKDDRGKKLLPSGAVKKALDLIRAKVPFADHDRVFHDDIEAIRQLIRSGELSRISEGLEF